MQLPAGNGRPPCTIGWCCHARRCRTRRGCTKPQHQSPPGVDGIGGDHLLFENRRHQRFEYVTRAWNAQPRSEAERGMDAGMHRLKFMRCIPRAEQVGAASLSRGRDRAPKRDTPPRRRAGTWPSSPPLAGCGSPATASRSARTASSGRRRRGGVPPVSTAGRTGRVRARSSAYGARAACRVSVPHAERQARRMQMCVTPTPPIVSTSSSPCNSVPPPSNSRSPLPKSTGTRLMTISSTRPAWKY